MEIVHDNANRNEIIPHIPPQCPSSKGRLRETSDSEGKELSGDEIFTEQTIKNEGNKGTRLLKIEASGHTRLLKEGKWSDWFVLKFSFNPFVKIYGIARFHVISLEPLKLYLSPISFHPAHPPLPISYPDRYAGDIARNIGLYMTLGWAIDTWALE